MAFGSKELPEAKFPGRAKGLGSRGIVEPGGQGVESRGGEVSSPSREASSLLEKLEAAF